MILGSESGTGVPARNVFDIVPGPLETAVEKRG